MKAFEVLLAAFLIFLCVLCYIHFQKYEQDVSSGSYSYSDREIKKLFDLIHIQNHTIHVMESQLTNARDHTKTLTLPLINSLQTETNMIVESVRKNVKAINEDHISNDYMKVNNEKMKKYSSKFEQECEMKYGVALINTWKKNKQSWCKISTDRHHEMDSQLKCYPYHQAHKKLDGRGPDVFCEAANFLVDFSKIEGQHGAHKPHLGDQYHTFHHGSLQSTCKKTDLYQSHLFMPHHSLQMSSFVSDVSEDVLRSARLTVSTTTYLLARDEDCENTFHSTADFMNMYLVKEALDLDVSQLQVLLFDKHPDGPYMELIRKAFSPNHPVVRSASFNGQTVLFRHLVFHLESPAGLIFPKVSRPDPLRCYDTSLFDGYRRHVLQVWYLDTTLSAIIDGSHPLHDVQAFDLLDVPPPAIPTIALSLRNRTPQKNVGRVMGNEKEVVSTLQKANQVDLHIIDGGKMSFADQLRMIRQTNVLVGIHGAGLMMIMFAAEEAVLVEIHPSYRQDRHFRHAARMTGKIYMPLRATQRETCHGSSDTVTVPLHEFEKAMDGAVRIARSFDDGLSECGLYCPPEILAMDSRLKVKSSQSINTNFPCG